MKTAKKAIWILLAILFVTPGLFSQTVGITGDSTINQCETKTYTITILNNSGNPLTNLVITALLQNFTGFSYVGGTTGIDVNSGGVFCTADPQISPGYSGTCSPAPAAPYLVWDIDALCPGSPFTLNNGATLDITFDLATDCSAVSGSLNTYIDYHISGTPFCDDTGAHSIQVLPGGVTIKKVPNVIPQELWQNVTWTLTVENTGFGIIENIVVTDLLGAGLAYISSSPAGNNAGQTTTWNSVQIPGFAAMNPGEKITIDITAQVIACEFLENNADVRWGCDMVTDCYNTAATLPPATATASVQRIVKTPLIDYTPPNVSFNYCEDYVDVNFTVSNTGDGRAHDVWLLVDFGSLSVSNVSAGAVYNNIDKRFELTNPLTAAPGPGNTYDLSFRLNFNTWCGSGFPSGDLLWQTVYKDDCDNEFYPPVKLSTINSPANSSSLAVGKTGAPTTIQIGDQITYNITSSYSGPLSCGSGPGSTTDITVIDTLPDGFSVVNNGGGIYVPGGGGTGGTITWTYTPPASLNTNITIQAPSAADCETYCFTTFTNSITAAGTDCCGCSLSASASQTTAIECEELVDSDKTAVPGTGIRCDTILYTNTYIFADNAALDSVDLSQLVFLEYADSEQEYDPGSLAVTLSGSGDITACALSGLTDTTPGAGGNLNINFSNCSTYGSIRNRTLTVSYRLTITENTVGACSGATFYSWSTLDLNFITGSECLPDGEIHETTVVSVDPPAMSLSVTGLGQIVHKCESQTITITLTQTSSTADPKDVRLVLSGLNYYVVDPAATICSGTVAPTSCTPAIIGSDYAWYFADGFTGSGQSASLQLEVQKRCSGSGDLVATAYFDDNCNDDGTYDDTCSVSAMETPALLLSGDLLIEKNPEVVYVAVNTIQWKIYLTNRGSGTAYNVWLDDELGSGLDYVSAVVDNMTGVTVTADQDHESNVINGCNIAIAQMAAGERREITFNALLVDCSNLTNDVSASWGCGGVECQTEVSDNATVEIPRPLLINTNVVTTPADACSDPAGSITLRNAGQTTCYSLQITETLPAGLSYIPGSTRWQVNGAGWNGPDAAYDPNPTASPLQWTSTEIPGLAQSDPGDTIRIEFDMEADCPFTGGNVTVGTSYENPCGQVFNTANSVFTVAFREPQVTVTKTRADEPIDCGDLVEWTITVQNTSGYTLPIIWVEDTLGSSYTYQSSVGDPPFTSDNGTFDGTNTVSWELRNVNHTDTVNLTIRATADNPPCSASLDNTVIAWWGCGTSDGSSATKPGVNPPDNSLCLTTTGVSDTNTPTREPAIGFLDISLNPMSIDSCNDNTQLTVTVQNTGPTDAENVDLVITLPAGITYNAGSSTVTCGGVTNPAADPSVSGNQLIYYNISDDAAGKANNICDTVQVAGGNDTLVLVFSVNSECYVTSDVRFDLYYYDCCEDTQYSNYDSETLTALYPDLAITKTPVNSQVDCNANQTWAITVTNNGSGNAQVVRIEDTLGDWIDYIGSAPAATAMGGQIYGWEINNLAAGGGSQSFTITGQLNPDAPQSDCTALLRQNNVRAIWGCGTAGDAADNDPTTPNYDCTHTTWANAPAATLQMPDLVVTAITPVIDCISEGNFSGSITVTVQNQGNGNSVNNFTVEITDGNGWTGTGTYNANVAPGASAAVIVDVTGWIPDCVPCAAPYTFNVTNVDLGDAVCECNEGNNTFGPVTYLTAIPDLEVAGDTLAITCLADGQYRVAGNVTLRNAGCAGTLTQDVPMRFTLFSGAGCGGALLAQWTQTFTGINIPAGGTQTFAITNYTVVGDACTSASGCQFSIRTEADYSDTICECDGTDNTLCSDKNFTIPDLRVDSETLAISCSADGQFRIQGNLVIANDGCGANLVANIPIRIRVYNDYAACTGTNGVISFNQAGVNIPAGGTQTFAVNRTLARNLCADSTSCQVAVGIELDYNSSICECTNTNNNYCAPNKTVPIPDLQVSSETLSVTCLQDGQVRVAGDVSIANTGCNAAVTGNVPLRFTLFSDINCGGVQLNQWTETFAGANITAGSSQAFTIANRDIITNICSNSTGCQVSLRIEVDPTTVICECSGTNNSLCSNKTVNVPDLRITAITPAVTCTSDNNLSGTVQVTVNNNGCGTATNITVRLTSNCGFSFTDQSVASLTTGSSTNITFTYTPVGTNCTCMFTAAADPDNIICECDGTNNSLTSAPFTITVPDIEVQTDSLAVNCLNDSQVTLSGTVTLINNGCGVNLSNDIPVRFTLFDNPGCAGNQVSQWTETLTGVNIPSGGGAQAFTITPQNVTSDMVTNSTGCQVSILLEADYSGTICEFDGSDNTYCADNKAVDIPDLEVQADTLAVNCFDDGQVTISGTVTMVNNGCGSNLTDNVPVRFTLFDNSGCGGNQLLQWTETFAGVNIPSGGGTQIFTLSPQNLTADLVDNSTDCRVSMRVEADYTNNICESDGTDNTYCADNINIDIPDIEVQSESLAISCTDDRQYSISGSVTMNNNGCGSNLTGNIAVRFTVFNNPGCGGDQVVQWTETFSAVNIPAGGGSQVFPITVQNFTGNLCNNSSDCRLSILIETDYTNAVCESDGTDNHFCANKTLEFPNLIIDAVATSITCLADGSLTGTNVTVRNSGCGDATGVVVRLTSDCGLTFADQTVALAAGESRDLIFPFTSGITTCSCHFTAVIDPDNIVCECDGTDNTLNSTTIMRIPDIDVQNENLLISCLDDGVIRVSGTVTLVNNGCGLDLIENVNMRYSLFDNTGCGGTLVHQWVSTFTGVSIPAAGGSQTFTIQSHNIATNFCTNSTGCQVSLLIEADYNNSICEWDGTDNTYCTDKTSDCIDVEAVSITPDTRCRADGNITGTIRVNINNSGGNSITHDFSIRVDDGAGWSSDLRYNADLGGILPLPAGVSSEVTFEWNRTFSNRNCTFNNINVLIDSQNEICQCTTANDTLATTYRLDYPNLLPTAIAANCSADGTYIVQVTVANNGCGRAGNFTLNLTDNHGNSKDIVVEGLDEGDSKTVDFLQWPALCEANSVGFTARVDSHDDICESDDQDQILEYLLPDALPDLIMGDIGWVCNPDGTITFTIVVSNQGGDSADNVPVTVTDNNDNLIFNRTIDLPAGASEQLSFTTVPFAKNIDHTFRFVVDGTQTICECSGSNNEKSIIVNCPGGEDESPLQIEKICPPGQQPGGLFRFELRIQNSGPGDLVNVTIEDFLPEGFRYVTGSSALDGQAVADPQIGDSLTWQIGILAAGKTATLIFTAVADADIDPGRYCNEANASAHIDGSNVTIRSPKTQCCTVVSREAGAGCCLDVEEWPMGFFHWPEGPISFIEPYFHTETAMYTVYAIFKLWDNSPLQAGSMPLFMKERLRNYARSNMEEFYLNSRSGLTLPDGSLRLSFAGIYPEQDDSEQQKPGWLRKQVDQIMTTAQLGFELLALNETRKSENNSQLQQKLERIIQEKLDFLAGYMTDLPHGWELFATAGKSSPSEQVKKLAEKANLFDKVSLYLALAELAQSGYDRAKELAPQVRGLLGELDNRNFDPKFQRAELFFILALLENGENSQAGDKVGDFESLYKKATLSPLQREVGANEDGQDAAKKDMLNNLHDYALAAAVDYKTGGSLYPDIVKRMKETYYLKESGIFADKQPDFTFKLDLGSLASLILSFDTADPAEQERCATVLYRTFDEVGLFLKKRNLVIGKPLYSMLKNYPFPEPLQPVLPFTRAKRNIAPVFSQDAVIHTPGLKPIGEVLIPHDFSKILSPAYETRTSRTAALSFGLQYFGRYLMASREPVIREEGRSFLNTGKKYLDSLLQSGSGILFNGVTLLPFEEIAVKGSGREKQNLEPVDSGVTFSTETLANYLIAEKLYLENDGAGVGENAGILPGLLAEQVRIVEKFADFGYIPLTFNIFAEKSSVSLSYALIPSRERASKMTAAKIYHALRSEKIGRFIESLLKNMKKESDTGAVDLVFLSAVPELLPYFKEEISDLIELKDSNISLNSADIIGRRLLGQSQTDEMKESLQNLHRNWDKDAALPKSDRIENIEQGLIYHHEPRSLLLYLLAVNDPANFRFKRTLNFFTYLLENEWGVAWQKTLITLPSAEYLVFKEEPRQNAEPGDLLNFKVRVGNTCPEGFAGARDIGELFLRSSFTPSLFYRGTQPVDGLLSLGDFQWRFNGFPEGSLLEYVYQAYIPADFRYDYIDGSIYTGGRQGFQDFGPDSAAGDNCVDIHQAGRLLVVPLTPLHGQIFEDSNVNGVKDVGEPGIPNILIKDTRGRILRSDADGRFIIMAGKNYEGVQIELKSLPADYLLTTAPTRLVNRHFVGDIYFALIPIKTVNGFVFSDNNGNGLYDDGESKPAGVLLQAKDKEVLTGENGEFIFRNLPKLWQEWIKIKPEQLYYKDGTANLRIFIPGK